MNTISSFTPSFTENLSAVLAQRRNQFESHRSISNLQSELVEIRWAVQASGFNDSLTESIRSWQECFSSSLEIAQDKQAVKAQYIKLMQEMLKDPIDETVPLDEDPLLGSDGETYNKKFLAVWRNMMPEQYRDLSPLHPNSPEPFTTQSHVCAKKMVSWLKSHNALFQSEVVETAYARLPRGRPTLSDEDRMASLMARRAELNRMRAGLLNTATIALDTQILGHIPQVGGQNQVALNDLSERVSNEAATLEAVGREINRTPQDQAMSLEQLGAQIRTAVESIYDPVFGPIEAGIDATTDQLIAFVQERGQASMDAIQEKIRKLEESEKNLTASSEVLQKNIEKVENLVENFKEDEAKLQKNMDKVQKGIKDLKKKKLEKIAGSIAVCAVCIGVTYALGGAGLLAPQSGGFSLTCTIPL